ncbi:Fucose 4-O-acetylase [Streptomyces sp. WMMB 714]|uniref:acyltransferase family protein n=1 Tax=Streptomyces sp. WMMB 714 TaxID=1286822 RepID=UPI0008237AB8|nr:acyltransferase family protein [Streptomyces sp. WMMB 714]SCK43965.1 Fucose 4-O-acetylase [Streptomyces sp. WMMB 714]
MRHRPERFRSSSAHPAVIPAETGLLRSGRNAYGSAGERGRAPGEHGKGTVVARGDTGRARKRRAAAPAGGPEGTAARPRTARDPHWDNVRFASGTLVLVGHVVEPLGHLDGLRWLYIASWALRVPVFVIVAGYFSSAGPLGRRELRQLSEAVLAPYLLIGLLHTLQIRLLEGHWKFFTSQPAWGLWFLLSLFMWRMLLPYLAVLRYPLLTAMAAALAVGYLDDFTRLFSASRTVAFLPFFVLGWQLRRGLADQWLRARWSRGAAVLVLAATAAAAYPLRYGIDTSWLGMQASYAQTVSFAPVWAWGPRGAVLVCGMLIALSFIRLMPGRRLPVVTYLGAGGLFIYLLHPLVLRALFHFVGLGWVGPWYEQLAVAAFGCVLAAALASPPVRRLARPLVQPRMTWLYAPEDSGGRAPSAPPRKEPSGEPSGQRRTELPCDHAAGTTGTEAPRAGRTSESVPTAEPGPRAEPGRRAEPGLARPARPEEPLRNPR